MVNMKFTTGAVLCRLNSSPKNSSLDLWLFIPLLQNKNVSFSNVFSAFPWDVIWVIISAVDTVSLSISRQRPSTFQTPGLRIDILSTWASLVHLSGDFSCKISGTLLICFIHHFWHFLWQWRWFPLIKFLETGRRRFTTPACRRSMSRKINAGQYMNSKYWYQCQPASGRTSQRFWLFRDSTEYDRDCGFRVPV